MSEEVNKNITPSSLRLINMNMDTPCEGETNTLNVYNNSKILPIEDSTSTQT